MSMKCQDVIFVGFTDVANANRWIDYSLEFNAISNTRYRCVSCVKFLFRALETKRPPSRRSFCFHSSSQLNFRPACPDEACFSKRSRGSGQKKTESSGVFFSCSRSQQTSSKRSARIRTESGYRSTPQVPSILPTRAGRWLFPLSYIESQHSDAISIVTVAHSFVARDLFVTPPVEIYLTLQSVPNSLSNEPPQQKHQ